MHGSSGSLNLESSYFIISTTVSPSVRLGDYLHQKMKWETGKGKFDRVLRSCGLGGRRSFSSSIFSRIKFGLRVFQWTFVFWLTLISAFPSPAKARRYKDFEDYYEVIERSDYPSKSPYGGGNTREYVRGIGGGVQTNRDNTRSCYSCMSNIYGALWDEMKLYEIYQKPGMGHPGGFTDHCRDPSRRPKDVQRIDCPKNSCITMIETVKIGYGTVGYIRGCYNSIFKKGFNNTPSVTRLNFTEFCAQFNLTELAQGQTQKMHNSELRVCSCIGHLCNSASQPSVMASNVVSTGRILIAGSIVTVLATTWYFSSLT